MPKAYREGVFRAEALRHDELPEEEVHLPRLATPEWIVLLWLAVVLLGGMGIATLVVLLQRL